MRSLGYTTQGEASIRSSKPGTRAAGIPLQVNPAMRLWVAPCCLVTPAKCEVRRKAFRSACSVLVFVMASLSCSSACGSWSLARGSGFGAGVWVLRCPVGAEHAAGCRLIALGLSVVSAGCGLGVVSFTCRRSAVPALRLVSAGVAGFVPAV